MKVGGGGCYFVIYVGSYVGICKVSKSCKLFSSIVDLSMNSYIITYFRKYYFLIHHFPTTYV